MFHICKILPAHLLELSMGQYLGKFNALSEYVDHKFSSCAVSQALDW